MLFRSFYGNWKALHYRAQALFQEGNGERKVEREKWEAYYSIYPKDRHYPDPKYTVSQALQSDGSFMVMLKAGSDLYDVFVDTDPHIDGHFTRNFVDLRAGEKMTTRFVPVDPKADVSSVRVKVKTLNELYQ